ncbi:osmotically-inducible protein OsmY [Nakamurella sp. UYEF19]|uniref:BON domain-containing protein n=1 Tax=Nakamurella sp. UYEF19 TaxID=1756392 RepID=UPI0033909620
MTKMARTPSEKLQISVLDQLRGLPGVEAGQIGVAVDGGCVTLTGEVETYSATLSAAKAALQVPGITAVAQELTVRGGWAASTDSDIGRQAAEALDRAVDVPETVKISIHNHVITLSGEVAWPYEAEAACRAVNYILGVNSVRNLMTLHVGAVGAEIERDITAALTGHEHSEGPELRVGTNSRGGVVLTGSVRSATEKSQAESVCWSAPGVRSVVDHLTIVD